MGARRGTSLYEERKNVCKPEGTLSNANKRESLNNITSGRQLRQLRSQLAIADATCLVHHLPFKSDMFKAEGPLVQGGGC